MNQAINFFWTIICFIPVVSFWVAAGAMQLCYLFIGISAISLLVPARVLQLSCNPEFYEAAGVKFIRKVVQNGQWINSYLRRRHPHYKLIKNKTHAGTYLKSVAMYERYHLLCFVFFMLTAGHAIAGSHYAMSISLIIANVIYNICPILLQQYNRARLLKLPR
ncbi:hypothetical protein [Mucilaginibacter sp.]|uniref:glycosyl-4,4'-diaponeurosporenoate acyltransferase CrtO family protein n=1 Tax=Mucilaginibacter sp. TaxID=1882438 RepID=UPI0035BC84E0